MPTFAGFAGEVVSNESAVIKNASFLFRSLHLPCEVPHWLCISKYTCPPEIACLFVTGKSSAADRSGGPSTPTNLSVAH